MIMAVFMSCTFLVAIAFGCSYWAGLAMGSFIKNDDLKGLGFAIVMSVFAFGISIFVLEVFRLYQAGVFNG